MFRKVWFSVASVLIMLGLLTGVAFAQAGDVDRGKQLWAEAKLCKNCHGLNGVGGLAGPRAGASRRDALAAAPEASMTVSGMSLGAANAPATKMPGRVVCVGAQLTEGMRLELEDDFACQVRNLYASTE
ncbi:MAG: cytochrome c, partial [Chloroflexi bacterium]|nr:cytochrome c [Chloroflexota bacterium]